MTVNNITILKLEFGYRFWVFSVCSKYSHTPLSEPSKRKTCSTLSRSISQEVFLTIFTCFFTLLWVCWSETISNAQACNHMSTITIVVFTYHCHDSNIDDNNSHAVTQPYYIQIMLSWLSFRNFECICVLHGQ